MNISVVVPCFNEEKNIKPLYSKLNKALKNLNIVDDYEIIFVDDGSIDRTYDRLASIKDKKVSLFKLKNNTGKSNALKVGFKKTKYDVIITLDGDLQNDPSDIEGMLRKFMQGYDCVCGWRYDRNDPFIKRLSSKIANCIRKLILRDNFHDSACGMHVFKKYCLEDLPLFNGAHRFFPILIQSAGYKVIEHKIKHNPRKFGKSKYNVRNRIFKSLRGLIYVKKIIKGYQS